MITNRKDLIGFLIALAITGAMVVVMYFWGG